MYGNNGKLVRPAAAPNKNNLKSKSSVLSLSTGGFAPLPPSILRQLRKKNSLYLRAQLGQSEGLSHKPLGLRSSSSLQSLSSLAVRTGMIMKPLEPEHSTLAELIAAEGGLMNSEAKVFEVLPAKIQTSFYSPLERLRLADEARYQFHCLPEKIQKSQFSKEEQAKLAGAYKTESKDLGIESRNRDSRDHLHNEPRDQIRSKDPKYQTRKDCGVREAEFTFQDHIASATYSTSSLDNRYDASDFLNQFFFDRPDDSTDMSIQEQRPESHPRRSSFRRNLSLTSIPFSRTSTSSAQPVPPTPTSAQRPFPARSRAGSNALPRNATMVNSEADTKHYQDPKARRKVRTYLTSNQGFEEVVAYGFPMLEDEGPPKLTLNMGADATNFSNDVHTFLKDDSMLFLDDNEEDELSADDSSSYPEDSPVTPAVADDVFRLNRLHMSNTPSLNSQTSKRPAHIDKKQSLLSSALENREMTLRMTLTPSDLRADDDALYGWQKEPDALALEDLPPEVDDDTGGHGAFALPPKRQSGLKWFLSKVKGGH
ncbi:hypothetical protein M501DRAFT_1033801 [Patellaria atrata CBS 101060]|uniref:Mucin n=1 Tax=Patellaria atrata CBS 101060 TaxID=1346257 RepID=A0A9P4S4W1_9PEZI|nr:hypothetical protein M501DRAFT_1033801 [Patellaria atrata CBS 101060]